MGDPSSSWQNFNFQYYEGSAQVTQGILALRLLLVKLQEAQANPLLKPSINNLLMTQDLMLTSTQCLSFSVTPLPLELQGLPSTQKIATILDSSMQVICIGISPSP